MIYHLACRLAEKGEKRAPSRLAKYNGVCAASNCEKGGRIIIGQTISCVRDNVNGARRTATADGSTSDTSSEARDPNDDDSDDDVSDDVAHAATVAAATLSPALVALLGELGPHFDARYASRETKAGTDEDRVRVIAREIAEAVQPKVTRVEVVLPDASTSDVGLTHHMFPTLVKALASGCNVWVTGPAGSGKTTAVHQAAKALGLSYHYTGSCQDQYALTGYQDANGRYVRTQLREAYEHGGLFLWDEVDASDPNALLAFNAMLANGTAAFPDAMVDRHRDTRLACTANTFGLGGTQEYVGRNRLDAAFLDRWVVLDWQIDEDLEKATCANADWVKRVQRVREKVKSKGMRVLVTPRASYYGARLLASGLDQDTVEAMTLRKGMTTEQWNMVRP